MEQRGRNPTPSPERSVPSRGLEQFVLSNRPVRSSDVASCPGWLGARSAEFLGEPAEESFGPADIAEQVHVFVLDDFVDELRAVL